MAAPADATVTAPFPLRHEELSGWGRAMRARCWVARPSTREAVAAALSFARERGLRVAPRGAGQSYGDASLADGELCLDLSRMRRILDWDPASGRIRLEPGLTVADLWRHAIEDGYWPVVVPGTARASLGGCAAMNVHGKNHFRVGPFGEHVEEIELLLPDGSSRTARPGDELFRGAVGGFGMLGAIVALSLRLPRVHSGLLEVQPWAVRSLDEAIDLFAARAPHADYLVGWVDCFAKGAALGRGLVHEGRHLRPGEDPNPGASLRVAAQELPDTLLGVLPRSRAWVPMRALFHPPGIRLVNAARYALGRRGAGRRYLQPHAQFHFLLDFFPDWGRAYGRHGMIQYQSFVPDSQARSVFRSQLELAQRRGLTPFLGVLKRHRRDSFLVSHGVDGYSLALEIQLTRSNRTAVAALARELDRLVIEAGGRFYLAKDSTLTPANWAPFLAEEGVQRFLALKRELDPEGRLASDLYRRLFAAAPEGAAPDAAAREEGRP